MSSALIGKIGRPIPTAASRSRWSVVTSGNCWHRSALAACMASSVLNGIFECTWFMTKLALFKVVRFIGIMETTPRFTHDWNRSTASLRKSDGIFPLRSFASRAACTSVQASSEVCRRCPAQYCENITLSGSGDSSFTKMQESRYMCSYFYQPRPSRSCLIKSSANGPSVCVGTDSRRSQAGSNPACSDSTSTGLMTAFGFPSEVMVTGVPAATKSSNAENFALAARTGMVRPTPSTVTDSFSSMGSEEGFSGHFCAGFDFMNLMWSHVTTLSRRSIRRRGCER